MMLGDIIIISDLKIVVNNVIVGTTILKPMDNTWLSTIRIVPNIP